MKHLVAIDIGNTSVHIAFMRGERCLRQQRVSTHDVRSKALSVIKKLLPRGPRTDVVIASVVPAAGRYLKKAIPATLGVRTFWIGKDYRVPIINRYKNPRQVGVDRLLNGLAAFKRYHGACIVVDFGTAITFDVVNNQGEYLGGVIAPGIEISLEALFQKTALLPKIRLKHPRHLIGQDTVESIRVGCTVGIGGLCDRIIEQLEKKYRLRAKVIATGGYAHFMTRYCTHLHAVDPELILKGIALTHKYHE